MNGVDCRRLTDEEVADINTVKELNEKHYKTLNELEAVLKKHQDDLNYRGETGSTPPEGTPQLYYGCIYLFGQKVFALRKPATSLEWARQYAKEYVDHIKNMKKA